MHLLGRINNSVLKERGVHNLFLRVYFYIDALCVYVCIKGIVIISSHASRYPRFPWISTPLQRNYSSWTIPRNKSEIQVRRGFSVTHRNRAHAILSHDILEILEWPIRFSRNRRPWNIYILFRGIRRPISSFPNCQKSYILLFLNRSILVFNYLLNFASIRL